MAALEKSVAEMAEFCPSLAYESENGGVGGWWTGAIVPVKSVDRLRDLLDDLHHGRPIHSAAGGELRHLPVCQAQHCIHSWTESVRTEDLLRNFDVRIYWSGLRDDPRCWVKGIDSTNGRHVWGDGSVCPFMSSTDTWDSRRDTVADFVGHVSIWLVSWMVFQQTGLWIVGEHGNTPSYHLATIKANEHCWCRSGRKYRKCHMREDYAEFARFGR